MGQVTTSLETSVYSSNLTLPLRRLLPKPFGLLSLNNITSHTKSLL